MAMPPEFMLVKHGFEPLGTYGDPSAPFDEETPSDWGTVWYDHGYVNAWESPSPSERFPESDAPINPREESPNMEQPEPPSGDAEERFLVRGEEAASWASLSRRALLRRMEED